MNFLHNDLSYGRSGKLKYQKNEIWVSDRGLFPKGPNLKQVTVWEQVFTPIGHLSGGMIADDCLGVNHGSGSRPQPKHAILKNCPEFYAWQDDGNFHQVSSRLEEISGSSATKLLALGRISDRRSRRQVGVAVSAAGPACSLVRFDILERSFFESDQAGAGSETTYISFAVGQGKPAWFDNGRGPIQQVVASHDESTWGATFAIQTYENVTILRPFLSVDIRRRNVRPNERARPYLEPSRLDPGYVTDIEARDWGMRSFGSVAFNPCNPIQIAAIDAHGRWIVWMLSEAESGIDSSTVPERLFHGRLSRSTFDPVFDISCVKLLWACAGKVLVATRNSQAIFYQVNERGVAGPSSFSASDMFEDSREIIVGLENCPNQHDSIVILTTRHFHLLRVKIEIRAMGDSNLSLETVFSRNLEPALRSLDSKMTLLAHQDDTLVALYNGASPNILTFAFKTSQSIHLQHQLNDEDSVSFRIRCQRDERDISADAFQADQSLNTLCLLPAVQNGDLKGSIFEANRFGRRRYFRALAFTQNLSLYTCLLKASEPGAQCLPADILASHSLASSRASSVVVEDDFVASEENDSSDGLALRLPSLFEQAPRSHRRVTRRKYDTQWSKPSLSEAVEISSLRIHIRSQNAKKTIEDEARKVLAGSLSHKRNIHTFAEFLSGFTLPTDSDNITSVTQEFLDSNEAVGSDIVAQHSQLIFPTPVIGSLLSDLARNSAESPSHEPNHGSLIKICVTPLPTEVHGRARVALNRMLRHLFVRSHLSSFSLYRNLAPLEISGEEENLGFNAPPGEAVDSDQKTPSQDLRGDGNQATRDDSVFQLAITSKDGSTARREQQHNLLSELGVFGSEESVNAFGIVKTNWKTQAHNDESPNTLSSNADLDSRAKIGEQMSTMKFRHHSLEASQQINSHASATEHVAVDSSSAIGDLLSSTRVAPTQSFLSSQLGGMVLESIAGSQPNQSQSAGHKTNKKRKAGFR